MDANGRGAVRFVRFLLSPPPEEMETRSRRAKSDAASTQGSASQRTTAEEDKVIVAPQPSGVEPAKFRSGSHWEREHLRLLGVDFYRQRPIDLNKILGVKEQDWPEALRARICLVLDIC